jgi:NAD(P)-dependent dehydrogenase (short-subunit alcohol dehydrogenase family)
MQVTSDEKTESSGSIILTASVAGIRSGAGTMDCKYDARIGFQTLSTMFTQIVPAKPRKFACLVRLLVLKQYYSVNSLAKTGSHQLGFTNIRVNTICPGLIEVYLKPTSFKNECSIQLQTGMTTFTFEYARAKGAGAKIGQLVPLKRFGLPQEVRCYDFVPFQYSDNRSLLQIANTALFLASGNSIRSIPTRIY